MSNLTGTDSADRLMGTSGVDSLYGLAGDDQLEGGLGADSLDGGSGSDTARYSGYYAVWLDLLAGTGYWNAAYNDVLIDIENLSGSDSNDWLYGDNDANRLDGGLGNDLLVGRNGDDLLVGGLDADTLDGGTGVDTADYTGFYAVHVDLAAGTGYWNAAYKDVLRGIENLSGSDNSDWLYGDNGDNRLDGGLGNDLLAGRNGADTLVGGIGDDRFDGGLGADTLEGGAGADTADYAGFYAVHVDLQARTGYWNAAYNDVLTGIENLSGSDNNDWLYGDNGDNRIDGGLGNDLLVGRNGADTLNGGAGIDTADYAGFYAVWVDLAAGAGYWNAAYNDVLTGVENLSGSSNGDWLYGDNAANRLAGALGDDRLIGRGGIDVLVGGIGDDRLDGGSGADTLDGGAGSDTADYAGYYAVHVDLAARTGYWNAAFNDTLIGIENLSGSDNGDWLYGDEGTNRLDGGLGNDLLVARGGADILFGGAGDDRLDGGLGADTLDGGAGSDTYLVDHMADVVFEAEGGGHDTVHASADYTLAPGSWIEVLESAEGAGGFQARLTGNELDNTIIGHGFNGLDGGFGNDTLIGGTAFFFTTRLDGANNVDRIIDNTFYPNDFVLDDDVFTGLASGDLSYDAFVIGTAALDLRDRIIFNPENGALFFDSDGTGGAAAIQFAIIEQGGVDYSSFSVLGPDNNAPVITSETRITIAESTPASTVIHTATAFDPDGDTFIFRLEGADADKFLIDPHTGELRLRSTANFETQGAFDFQVIAEDSNVAGRARILVTIPDIPEGSTPIVSELAFNDDLFQPQAIDRSLLNRSDNGELIDDALPSATIQGGISANGDRDFFSIYLNKGEKLVLDVDQSAAALDALVRLYGVASNELGSNDDSDLPLDAGSTSELDSFIQFRAPHSGTFKFSIESWNSETSGSYELHVSVGPPSSDLTAENIQALLSGHKWNFNFLTYGFPTLATDYTVGSHNGEPANNFGAFDTNQQLAIHQVIDLVEAYTNKLFIWDSSTPGDANLRYALSDLADPAYAYLPSSGPAGGSSWYSNSSGAFENGASGANPIVGSYAYYTFMHETGHALGLKHAHEYSIALSHDRDSMEFSVMTYRAYIGGEVGGAFRNETSGYAQTYMMFDIAALQQLYGADFTDNAEDSVYRWDALTGRMTINGSTETVPGANRVFLTVWDGGGNDTYDLSNYTDSVAIDLRPGEWTTTSRVQLANLGDGRSARGNVANALLFNDDPRSLIENAIGGAGDDYLMANEATNRLTGGAGRDTFSFAGGGLGASADIVTDFVSGTDKINLISIDADTTAEFDQPFGYIGSNAFNHDAGELRSEVIGGRVHLFGDVDGDAVADIEIIVNAPAIKPWEIDL